MSRRNKKDRARRLAAAEAFVEAWTSSGLASTLIDDYDCTLNCDEAETYAALFRSFGYVDTADGIIFNHSEHDECGDQHHECDAWTFTVELEGVESDDFTVVTDGESLTDAEGQARLLMKQYISDNYAWEVPFHIVEKEPGVPGPNTLYGWYDGRECKKESA